MALTLPKIVTYAIYKPDSLSIKATKVVTYSVLKYTAPKPRVINSM